MRGLRPSLALLALAAATASTASAGGTRGAVPAAEPAPVASLEPERTQALWTSLVARQMRRSATSQTGCRPLRTVFYAATDWLRLATKLAAGGSPCAEYYVSVPAIVGNRTQLRRDAAWRIRALGPNFHAMAEIHFTMWSRWVQETGSSWYTAGVTARQRMAEAGYDVALGDTWQLNELSTAVRRGEGNARANIREFLRGLYEGDGSRPTRGAALVVGVGQRTGDLSVYQNTLQSWLADAPFWTDMATYVSDWSQEVYGDVRSHAVPGVPTAVRREYLNDYLQHKLVLAGAGPVEIEPARAFLRERYSPLANAAWERDTGYGWTMVPVERMAAYVSAQVHALRFHSATAGQAHDRWGFAWAPRNATAIPAAEFASRTSALLDRLAAAIRDSGSNDDPENPGSAACGPPGQDSLCAADVEGARHNDAWRSFRGWTQAVLRFATPPAVVPAGSPSSALTLSLVTASGLPVTGASPVSVTLRSSSPQGSFARSASGPWTGTLPLTLGGGASSSSTFFYRDTRAGSHTLTASAAGATQGMQVVTVAPGPAARIVVSPASGEVRARGTRRFTATASDAYGNPASATLAWRVRPAALGTLSQPRGATVTFTAARVVRAGTVTATATTPVGTVSASASLRVTPARLRIASVTFRPGRRAVRVTVAAFDGARRPVSNAAVTVAVRRDGRPFSTGRARTGAAGRMLVRVPLAHGCFTVTVTRATAAGFTWDRRTPRNRFCRR